MTLEPGTRLGPYEIVRPLGKGGMGEVYEAHDPRLQRPVAIKVLPAHVRADATLLSRFQREARALSALSHPHVCSIYDVGSEGEIDFLVMERLEGETLHRRLERGAMPLDEALDVAIEIAGALDAAHRRGIVHRDLKPGNVMLTKAGAKLLDFGLARRRPPGPPDVLSDAPTATAPDTAAGTLLGTLPYMAPEQVEGREADARTDVFAFGAVLHEMVTGRRAFGGKSQASLVARDPREAAAAGVDAAAARASGPRPRRADVPRQGPRRAVAVGRGPAARALLDRRGRGRGPEGAGAPTRLAALAGAGRRSWGWPRSPESPSAAGSRRARPSQRSCTRSSTSGRPRRSIGPHALERTAGMGRPSRTAIALSPDGRRLAFVARQGDRQRLYVRALDEDEARPLPGTEGADNPFFSPDGQALGFWSGGAIRRVALDGGPPLEVCPSARLGGAAWVAPDEIVFATMEGGLMRVAPGAGRPEPLTRLSPGEVSHRLPHAVPGGAVLFTVFESGFDKRRGRVEVLDRATGRRHSVAENAADARYVRTGHVVFARRGSLVAVPFDRATLRPTRQRGRHGGRGDAVPERAVRGRRDGRGAVRRRGRRHPRLRARRHRARRRAAPRPRGPLRAGRAARRAGEGRLRGPPAVAGRPPDRRHRPRGPDVVALGVRPRAGDDDATGAVAGGRDAVAPLAAGRGAPRVQLVPAGRDRHPRRERGRERRSGGDHAHPDR